MTAKTSPGGGTGGQALGFVLKGYPRISETFISNEIELLEQQGFDIHIFSMRRPREGFTHQSVQRIKARVTYLPTRLWINLPRLLFRNIVQFLKYPGRYGQAWSLFWPRFKRSGNKQACVKHLLQGGWLAHRGLSDGQVEHLHAHFAHSPTSVAMYGAVLGGITFSFTGHAKDIYTQKPEPLKEKIDLARFLITCTRYNKSYLETLAAGGEQAKHVHCVYHGIDLGLFRSEGKARSAEPPYVIMTVARFVPKKGLDIVFKALKALRQRGVDFEYVLVGDGDEKDGVMQAIRGNGLEDVTTLTGTIAHEEVLTHYERAHLFVLGCRVAGNGDRDGIPNVIAEAMAMGVPVAATEISGIPELIEHGETGLTVQSEDPDALSGIMERLLTDQSLREKIIPAARKKVEEVFDNAVLIEDLARVYTSEGLGPRQG